MPHAALWVVQQGVLTQIDETVVRFNAARGFVGGATILYLSYLIMNDFSFNAARGFVGGATASLAALVPLERKSPFGKSPEI